MEIMQPIAECSAFQTADMLMLNQFLLFQNIVKWGWVKLLSLKALLDVENLALSRLMFFHRNNSIIALVFILFKTKHGGYIITRLCKRRKWIPGSVAQCLYIYIEDYLYFRRII